MFCVVSLVAVMLAAPATQQGGTSLVILNLHRSLVRVEPNGSTQELPGARDIETMDAATSGSGIVATRGSEILLIPLDGHKPTLLYRHTGPVRFAAMSVDQQQLAFSSMDDFRIWVARRENDRFAAARALCRGYGPSFSSDGKLVFYEAGEHGLGRCDLQRGKSEPLLPNYAGAHTVRCSRDGRFIGFSKDRALYLYRTDDGSVHKLTSGDADDRFPSFTRDRVVFWRETRSEKRQVVSIGLDGTGERVLYEGDVELACVIGQD